VWRTFLKFDELRFWPSVSISLEIRGGEQKKEQLCSKKREQKKQRTETRQEAVKNRAKVLFLQTERNSRRFSSSSLLSPANN
jgi:hypothetical protein